MKKLNILLLLAILTFSFNSSITYATSKTATFQDERTIGSFKGIATGGPLTVKVTIGNKESIRFEGNKDAIADLITEVNDNILVIKPKTKWNDWSRRYNRPEVIVYITAKRLTSLTLSGSGSLEVENPVNGSDLVTTLSGSGSIKVTANVNSFEGVLSGSGTLNVAGKTTDANLTVSGSGNLRGKSFTADKASVQISGSANVYIKATGKLEAVISGSGNIYYSGDATVKKTVIGSGNISKM